MGTFNKFCLDFGLSGRPSPNIRLLSKDEVTSVFKRTCEFGKQMNFEQFWEALAVLAETFYNEDGFGFINSNVPKLP
jgi:hypothetical protein